MTCEYCGGSGWKTVRLANGAMAAQDCRCEIGQRRRRAVEARDDEAKQKAAKYSRKVKS
jgi:hypothetical protein